MSDEVTALLGFAVKGARRKSVLRTWRTRPIDNRQHNDKVVYMHPAFEPPDGYLPPGVHSFSWDAFLMTFAWNQPRRFLASGLQRALANLKMAGCRAALIDGSYVTDKALPSDYDMAFDPVGVDGSKVDPVLLRHDDGRSSMKAKYFGDVFPWGSVACLKTGMIYRDFFQFDREGRPKGIVLLGLRHTA